MGFVLKAMSARMSITSVHYVWALKEVKKASNG